MYNEITCWMVGEFQLNNLTNISDWWNLILGYNMGSFGFMFLMWNFQPTRCCDNGYQYLELLLQ